MATDDWKTRVQYLLHLCKVEAITNKCDSSFVVHKFITNNTIGIWNSFNKRERAAMLCDSSFSPLYYIAGGMTSLVAVRFFVS
jgi:hypothetical protein